MITLGGVLISDNMYLEGIERAAPFVISSERAVDGMAVSRAYPTPGGRKLTLGTSQISGVQGIWCQSVIDDIKSVQGAGGAVQLDYHGDIYTVYISSTASITQLFSFQPVTPNKNYVGVINLVEA